MKKRLRAFWEAVCEFERIYDYSFWDEVKTLSLQHKAMMGIIPWSVFNERYARLPKYQFRTMFWYKVRWFVARHVL